MLLLACFSVYFSRFYQQTRGILEEIAYDFGTFVMFSIFKSIILLFPIRSNFLRLLSKTQKNQAN